MTSKSFFQLLISLILIFGLIVMSCFVAYVTTSGGSFLGYEFNSVEQNPYVNVLLMGLDKDGTRTDVLIFAQLNMIDGEINMLQIPRDTYRPNNGRRDKKINSAYGVDKEKSVLKEVGELLGVHIDKYVTIDIKGFRDLIDTIGGVDFYVPQNMHYEDPTQDLYIHLNEGQQHLDGDKAEQLVRFRNYPMGDLDRMKVQSDFIQATVDHILRISNVTKIDDMVEDFSKTVKTNFSFNEMLTYAPYVLATERSKIVTHQLVCDPVDIGGGSYVIANDEQNEKLIKEHFTPTLEEGLNNSTLKASVEGDGKLCMTSDVELKKSSLNSFASVDIIDASEGEADVAGIKTQLEKYGYNVLSVVTAADASYEDTVVVSVRKNNSASRISKIAGTDNYIHNPHKKKGSDVTIILGKNNK